jgi:hypothetical protein
MNRQPRVTVLVAFLLVSASCGYFQAGTWEDDPDNWSRAFNSTKPADVIVVHSQYWRSPHWSYECEYFFQLAPNTALMEQIFAPNDLVRITGDDAARAKENHVGEPPAWFAPKSAAEYDMWVETERAGNFTVLIDKRSGDMFLSDHQL